MLTFLKSVSLLSSSQFRRNPFLPLCPFDSSVHRNFVGRIISLTVIKVESPSTYEKVGQLVHIKMGSQ